MKTILLIEDNSVILENLAEYLEMEGYKILTAECGEKGVKLAKEYIPDLIICDVLMGRMNGHEVLHLLLNCIETYHIPFVFSTSLSEKLDRVETLKLGADDYIIKPYELDTLLKIVKACLKSGSIRNRPVLAL